MNQNTYVYCTECIHGDNLIRSIINDTSYCPKICKNCYPYNPEDSFEFRIRKNYKENKTNKE